MAEEERFELPQPFGRLFSRQLQYHYAIPPRTLSLDLNQLDMVIKHITSPRNRDYVFFQLLSLAYKLIMFMAAFLDNESINSAENILYFLIKSFCGSVAD